MKRKIAHLISLLLVALVLASCSKVNDKNQLSVYVCDSPAEYSAVLFRIGAVEVREAGGAGGWVSLGIENGSVPLLTLVNGKMQQVAVGVMPSGAAYDAVRFTFAADEATVTVAGAEGAKTMMLDPADAVVVIEVPVFKMDGSNLPLLFDMDAASSVVADASAVDGYRFRPQVSFVHTAEYGVVQGGLQAGNAAMTSQAWLRFTDKATGVVFSTYSALMPSTGAFFMRLPVGDYTLEVIPADAAKLKPYSVQISISRQSITDLGVVVLEPIVQAGGES